MRSYLTTLGSLTAAGVMLAAFSSCGSDTSKITRDTRAAADPDLAAAKAALAGTPLGSVVSRDVRGAGRYVVASREANAPRLNLGHETVARLHLERHAARLGLSEAALRGAVFTGWHKLPGGAGLAQFEQRIDDIEVFRARASVVVDAANQLVSIGNSFPASNIKVWNRSTTFKKSAEEAMAAAYAAHAGVPLRADAVRDLGEIAGTSSRNYNIDAARGALQVLSATAKRVLFPTGDRLEAGYYIEILGRATGSRDNDARSYVIAASDMRTLYEESLTAQDVFNYKVWADPTGLKTPLDGPVSDMNPHPTGMPDGRQQTPVAQVMIAMEGFNHNPSGAADPWLKADDTYTWGNNVRAYSDRNQSATDAGTSINDGFQDAGPDGGGGDYRAEVTTAKTFDYTFDQALAPQASPNQIKASITQLFYTNNWLHDFWYDAGFDELARNAQVSNYMRGGAENDPIRAEAQDSADSGQANNANMSTLADGSPPRMQMYVWSGLPNRTLTVAGVTFTDPIGAAAFGPQVFDISGTAVLSDDGSTMVPPGGTGTMGTTADACQLPTNVMGRIAVIERGTCSFIIKAQNAEAAGASGILLINNVPGGVPPNAAGALPTATKPLLGVSMEDGVKLRAALMAGMPMTTLKRGVEVQRDGTIDNTIVAHEWGHYWHHRLVQCGGKSCGGMSEGWGDFVALMMSIRDGDTFDGGKTYALAGYASAGIAKDGSYYGIRRAPVSRELSKNPFTFQHIRQASMLPTGAPLAPTGADMSEVHNVGEIWTQTLFEAYANLIDAGKAATPPRTFEETQRLMAKYLVAGMKATPNEPTFVEQRDAILSAVYATKQMDDFTALAKGFAKRGLGVAAVAPPSSSMTLNEAVENMDYAGNLSMLEATIDDSGTSCDKDGVLDANETGKLTVKVKNTGWVKLTKTQIKATSTDPNVTFAMPGNEMASIEPYDTSTVTIGVSAKGYTKKTNVPITITLTDSEAAKTSVDVTYDAVLHYDDMKGSSKTDDVESAQPTVWEKANVPSSAVSAWSREGDAMNHVWRGAALASAGEESLVSPALTVSATEAFTIGFKHHYTFEVATGMLNADGAVLEIAEVAGDAGADAGSLEWKDISEYADPMYTGALYTMPGMDTNPLAGKRAWVGRSAGYPADLDVKLDLATKLAGKTIKVRFRIGTDEGTSSAGWDLDNIAFGGITNTPFASVGDHAGKCADAGTPTDAGARDATTGTGGTGGTTGGGIPPADDSCNCSIPGGRSSGGAAGAAGILGALAMVLRRRRRQQG